MKNNYSNKTQGSSLLRSLRFGLVALLMMVGGTAFAETVTFEPTSIRGAQDETSLTISPITMSFTSGQVGVNFNGTEVAYYGCFKGGTMTISSSAGNITSIEITCTASGTSKYGPGCFAEADGYSYEEKVGTWTGSATSVSLTASTNQVRISKLVVTYEANANQCNTPVLSPASGETFTESLTVTATTATEGAKVVYNTDGGTTFTDFPAEGLPLTETTTIYAKSVDPEGALTESSVVEATYTKLSVIEGVQALRSAIENSGSTAKQDYVVNLTNAVVTFVSGSVSTIEENGIGIYGYGLSGLEAGQVINGQVKVVGVPYNTYAELTSIDLTDATVTAGTAPEPTVVTVAQLQNDFATYGLRYVKLQNVTVTTACTADNRNGAIEQDGNTLTVRSNSSSITMDASENGVDITGVCVLYSGNPQLTLFSSEDVTVTGIDSVVAPAAKAGAIYDLSGRRVKTAERGLYIMNGQKVYVK